MHRTPLSEFTTEGYMTCAFPTLFLMGDADFSAPRVNAASIGSYFKHLMIETLTPTKHAHAHIHVHRMEWLSRDTQNIVW